MPTIAAIVLAGGRVPTALAPYCDHRALLCVQGRLMLDYLLETLTGVSTVADIAVVAPDAALPALAALPGRKIASGDSIVDNMRRGAAAVAGCAPTHLLFITGDIPLVTPAGVEDYLTKSVDSGASLTYPIIPREVSEARFPGAKRTYVKLNEGIFTGGNAIFATADLLQDKHALIQELYEARKQPLKLAQTLGLPTLLRFITGNLDLPFIESVGERILSAPVRAIITRYAEIGFDVDKPEDLHAVERALQACER